MNALPQIPLVQEEVLFLGTDLAQALADQMRRVPGADERVDRALEAARMRAAIREVE